MTLASPSHFGLDFGCFSCCSSFFSFTTAAVTTTGSGAAGSGAGAVKNC